MFCIKCGTKINDGEKFCTGCGTKVEFIEDDTALNPVDEQKKELDTVNDIPAEEAVTVSGEDGDEEEQEVSVISDEESETACADNLEVEVEDQNEFLTENDNVISDECCEEPKSGDENVTEAVLPIVPENLQKEEAETTVEQNVVEEDQTKKNENDKNSQSKIGIGYRILSWLLCIILFVVVLSTSLFGIVREVFSSENISDFITKIGASEIVVDGESIADIVYDNCTTQGLEKLNLDRDDVVGIVEAIEFEDVVDGILMPYVDYLLGFSMKVPSVDPTVITDILKDNKNSIIDAVGNDVDVELLFSDEVSQKIEAQAGRVFDNISLTEIEDEFAVGNVYARIISEKFFYICMIVICVLFGLLVLLANKLRFFRAIGDMGIVAIVVAVILGISYVVCTALPLVVKVPAYVDSLTGKLEFSLIIRMAGYAAAGVIACVACKIASVVAAKKEKT